MNDAPILRNTPSFPRYFTSIISTRVILNIRQYASVTNSSAETGAADMGDGTARPVSGLQFARGGRTISAVDTELQLY